VNLESKAFGQQVLQHYLELSSKMPLAIGGLGKARSTYRGGKTGCHYGAHA
jgi:hypothetical protein